MEAEEEEVESRAPVWRKKSRKRKNLHVTVEALAETSDRAAPMVAYFPSGYDPTRLDEPPPHVQAFRHARYPNRLDLVVAQGNVEFVGRSYAGEAAAGPQLCTYALGVLDKETQTLRIVPIAGNKILRLEPRVIDRPSAHSEPSKVTEEEVRQMADLTSLYGTKKDRDKDSKWRSLNQQRNDPTIREHLESQMAHAEVNMEALDDVKKTAVRNIPPHDPTAVTPEKAYPLDEIILKAERGHLLDILNIIESEGDFASTIKFWQDSGFPSFVYNRIHKLKQIQNKDAKTTLACILSYITHLVKFMELPSRARNSMSAFHGGVASHHNIPRIVYQKLMRMFVDPESQALSSEKKELLIGYILVLTLFVDGFRTDPSDISRDLKMPDKSLVPYYLQLGCKYLQGVMTLSVPLDFPELKRHRRRRR